MASVIIKKPTHQELTADKVLQWPVWEKEASIFDWYYDNEEHCYIVEGHIIVETDEGDYEIKKGDYVIFAKGLKCIWNVKSDVKKHYKFIG